MLTGVGAVVNTAKIEPGSTVAVVGLGGVGLASLLGAKMAGASRIVAVDLDDTKLALAKKLGATDCYNARSPDCVAEIREATQGGLNYAFELAGAIPAFETAYNITRRGGTTVTAGLPHPDKTMALAPTRLVAEERTIKGSYIGTSVPVRDLPRYISMFRQGKLAVDKLLTGRLKFEDINEGFDQMAQGKAVRQVITFD